MSSLNASFEITSKEDSRAARRILEQTYDTIREESKSVRDETEDATDLLQSFETLRDAARHPTPGTLTITYQRDEDGFTE
jgi:hypothetical protein